MSAPHLFTPLPVGTLDLAKQVVGRGDAELVALARATGYGPLQFRDLFDTGE